MLIFYLHTIIKLYHVYNLNLGAASRPGIILKAPAQGAWGSR